MAVSFLYKYIDINLKILHFAQLNDVWWVLNTVFVYKEKRQMYFPLQKHIQIHVFDYLDFDF
jgi:hypothetical protein